MLFSQQRSEEYLVVNEKDNLLIAELLEKRYFNYVYAKLYLGEIIRNNDLLFNAEFSLGEDTLFVMEYLQYVHRMVISGHVIYTYMKYGAGTLTAVTHPDKYIKLMYVNKCIEETFAKKNWNTPLVLEKIDERNLLSVEWAIESAEQRKIWSDKIQAVKEVLNSPDLRDAINRSGRDVLDTKTLLLYRTKSAEFVLLYRKAEQMKQHFFKTLRRLKRSLAVWLRDV